MKFRYEAMIPLRKVLSKAGDAGASIPRAITVWTHTPRNLTVITPVDEALGIQVAIDQAMTSQHHIGWVHFFRGFVSLDWGHIFSMTISTRLTLDERAAQAEKTLTTVIMAAQDYSLALWKSKNAVLHEDGSHSLMIVHAALNHSISQLYSMKHTLSPILQSYFTLPLEDRLQQAPRQRKRWLRLARLATSHASSRGTRQQLLPTYFPYDATTTAPTSDDHPLPLAVPITVPPILKQRPLTAYFSTSCP